MSVSDNLQRVHCNSCRSETLHRVLKTSEDKGEAEIESVGSVSWVTKFEMLECRGCKEVVLRRTYWFSEEPETDVRYFPPAVSRHPPDWRYHIPHRMMILLGEIYRALDADNRALPMMGARALVDMVMVDKVGDVGEFGTKLKRLREEGFISSKNQEILDIALDAGSAAAHRGFAPKESDVHVVMDIVENLLQSVYVFDKTAREIKKATPRRPVSNKR